MRTLREIVADFLNTQQARGCKETDDDKQIVCDLIAEMDEHFGNNPAKAQCLTNRRGAVHPD